MIDITRESILRANPEEISKIEEQIQEKLVAAREELCKSMAQRSAPEHTSATAADVAHERFARIEQLGNLVIAISERKQQLDLA